MTGPKLSRTWGGLAGKWRALFKRQKLPFKVASLADTDTGQKCCYSFKGRCNRHLMIRYSHEIICAEFIQNANIPGCRTIDKTLWEGILEMTMARTIHSSEHLREDLKIILRNVDASSS